jgi:hypothetical protein
MCPFELADSQAWFVWQAALEMQMDKVLKEVKAEKWGKIAGLEKKAANIVSQKSKDILKVGFLLSSRYFHFLTCICCYFS